MKKFLNKFFSMEIRGSDDGNTVKIFTIFGLKLKIKSFIKLKIMNDNYVDNPKVYLSIVAIAKNEGAYIKEWIEYHKLVGVERFYFYDNGSTDNTKEVLEPYIKDGSVIYNYCEGSYLQNLVYKDTLVKYKNQTHWLAIIDLDEFIVPVEKNSITEFLKDYEEYPAVAVNWVMFDSCGYDKRPLSGGGLVSANYIRVHKNYDTAVNRHVKSIVQPQKVIKCCNPHFCLYENNEYAVNENFIPVNSPFTVHVSVKKIRINHYFSKSREEYLNKIRRGRATTNKKRDFEESALNFPEYAYDYAIQKFLPELKRRMNINEELV